jgi:isovaleryl-CoA dehydrogenase
VSALLSSERAQLRARFFALGKQLAPGVAERDRAGRFDRAVWKTLADAGLFSLSGVGRRAAALEALAEGSLDLGVAVSAAAHFVVVAVVEQRGTPAQKARWLPPLLDGRWVAACANAERGAGTDLMAIASRARRDDDGSLWLSARKHSVTNLGACDFALVSARLHGVPAAKAVNVYGVETSGPRRQMRLRRDLSGLRTSPTGKFIAHRAQLETDAQVGDTGDGVSLFRTMFSEERITTGFIYLGALKGALAMGLEHAEQRRQFGQPIGRNQYVQDKLVKMQVAIELLEALLWSAVGAHDRAVVDGTDESALHATLSVIKVHGIDAAITAAQDLVRLLGARGLSTDVPAERLLRDLMGLSILGGTVELQKIVIYNEMARAYRATHPRPRADVDRGAGVDKGADDVKVNVDVNVVVRAVADGVATADEDVYRSLVKRAFKDEPSLGGGWYFGTRPTAVMEARVADVVVGIRTVVRRAVHMNGRDVVVWGSGAAVVAGSASENAAVDAALMQKIVADAEADGAAALMSFVLTQSSAERLRAQGFRRLQAKVFFLDADTGALQQERTPCYVRALAGNFVDEVESAGAIHVGAGIW